MKFGNFIILLYLISFYLVIGETINEEKSDCSKLYNFINGDDKDYSNNCCSDTGVKCDSGYITYFEYLDAEIKIPDLTSFPSLSRIEQLIINNSSLKEIPNNILNLISLKTLDLRTNNIEVIPPEIQNLSRLEELHIKDNKIKELPNELFNLKKLKILNLHTNHIEVIPPDIQNLSKLEELYLASNDIKELPKEFFYLRHLKKINLHTNHVTIIPPDIQNLSNLEILYLGDNDIKELPNEIFKLRNLKQLTLHENKNLKTKMVKFGNSAIGDCNFNNVNILCYEPNTCKKIRFNNKDFSDTAANNQFRICTREEIDEIKSKIDINDKHNEKFPYIIIGGIILGCILIGILVAFLFIRKRHNKSDLNSNDISENEKIKIVLNEKLNNNSNDNNSVINNNNINNNSNNNSSNDNNNNSNNNNSNNSNNSSSNNNNCTTSTNNNNNSNNNLNQNNLNQNIVVNSNAHNNTLPGNLILINTPIGPGNYVINSIPLFDNNQNNDNDLLTTQKKLITDKDKMLLNANNDNKGIFCYISTVEGDEPPPEYTDTNKSITKQQFM